MQLLGTAHGQPLQAWEFADQSLIHIGRSSDCDVVISSPVVSRSHAYLKREGEDWELCCVSQNGVFINGERVQTRRLSDGVVFRLASNGPYLRFRQFQEGRNQAMETIPPDEAGTLPLLLLDAEKRDRQVEAVADGEYFQQLQELARQLRQKSST